MQGVAEGIPKASGHPWGKSLVEFVQTKNNKLRDSAVHAGGLLKQMDAALSDPTTAAETRLPVFPFWSRGNGKRHNPF